MNVYDSQKMADLLGTLGYKLVNTAEEADLVILNTCNIREKATEKMYSDFGRLNDMSIATKKKPMITVAGCVAQAEGQEITQRAPYVNFVVGPQSYHELPELIAQWERTIDEKKGVGRGAFSLDFQPQEKFDALPSSQNLENPSQFLTIQEGCDKFCRFCCVPYTRGAEYSRPVEDILNEARLLVASGAKEITLLGQNVNAYHGESLESRTWGLGRLLFALSEIKGLERIRYTTSHPKDVDQELIEAHRNIPQLMPFLHLPVQSGSDRILKAMNRKHTSAFYMEIIDQLREAQPNLAFSSDFIVGYPDESDEDFADTLALVERVKFAQAFSFKYSRRPGTPAAVLEDQVPESLKDERLQALQALLQKQQIDYNDAHLHTIMPVLIEKRARKGEDMLLGRSPFWQNVLVEGKESLIGQIIPVKITETTLKTLKGSLINNKQVTV